MNLTNTILNERSQKEYIKNIYSKEYIKHDKSVPRVNLGQDLSKILRVEWP